MIVIEGTHKRRRVRWTTKLVGDDNVYLMPDPITVRLQLNPDDYRAVRRAEFVLQEE